MITPDRLLLNGHVVVPVGSNGRSTAIAITGERITLLGAGFGGSEPYTFAWTTPVGTIEGMDAPTAQLITTGVAAGVYDLRLTVTDSAGASATDTVKVRIASAQS